MKIVQIGTGGWGKNHCRVLSEYGVLSAICDSNMERSSEFGKKYSVNSYNSIEKLMENEDFDAAFICTPTVTHSEIAEKLIENKKHVFIEKPMTYLSEDGQKLVKIAEKNNVLFTPPLKSSALDGITRKTIIKLARDMKLKIKIQKISKNKLEFADEVFLSGTAAEITPVIKLGKRKIGSGKTGNITKLLMDTYLDIVMNKNKKYSKWLTKVY